MAATRKPSMIRAWNTEQCMSGGLAAYGEFGRPHPCQRRIVREGVRVTGAAGGGSLRAVVVFCTLPPSRVRGWCAVCVAYCAANDLRTRRGERHRIGVYCLVG